MPSQATTTVPALPCESFDETLGFWQALGYKLTYKQRAPNAYAVLAYEDYEIHFFGLKELKPENNFSTCLVIVPEVEQLHERYTERLRGALGKVPSKGFPRITRMKPGQTRFTITDNAGNSVIFIKRGVQDEQAADAYKQPDQTPLEKAFNAAARLRDYKNDDRAAAKTLDLALTRHQAEPTMEYARVLAARVELALALDEHELAQQLHQQYLALELPEAAREEINASQPALAELNRTP